jgi:hypothetical protein
MMYVCADISILYIKVSIIQTFHCFPSNVEFMKSVSLSSSAFVSYLHFCKIIMPLANVGNFLTSSWVLKFTFPSCILIQYCE